MNSIKNPRKSKKNYKTLSQYAVKYRWKYLFTAVMMFSAIGLNALTPVVIQHIVDDVVLGNQLKLLIPMLCMLALVGIGHAVTNYLKEYTSDCIGVRLGGDLRRDLFAHIQGLSIGFFHENNTGELMARVKDDIDKVWFIMGFAGMLTCECIIHTAVTLFCMLRLSPLLTVVPVAVMIVVVIVALNMEKQLDKCYGDISEENAELTTIAQENLSGVRTVRAFAREEFELEKFSAHNESYYQLNLKMANVLVKFQPFIDVAGKILIVLVVLAGGALVIFDNSNMTLGKLTAYVEYANGVIWPMECIAWLSNEIASASASYRKIKKILETTPDITQPDNPVVPDNIKGDLKFENVSFKLDENEILNDISFELKSGGTLGIMGMTGSGKSTIVNLIQRFYDVTDGRILLDGNDIRTLDLNSLRSGISVVMQDVFLFSDSIKENLMLGSRDRAGCEKMNAAAAAADASGFIERLEDKYDTIIGERGVGLSGGQKQRLSIARALIKDSPILLLDDATSALDMETEYDIQQSLEKLSGVSKIIIAHRISSVKNADEIIILKDGKIAERGTHSQLMAKRGLYFDTYRAQYNTEIDMVS